MKFIKSVFSEMKEVTWPKGRTMSRLTLTVVASIIILALFFAVVDLGVGAALRAMLNL